jgi:hypothetical protein
MGDGQVNQRLLKAKGGVCRIAAGQKQIIRQGRAVACAVEFGDALFKGGGFGVEIGHLLLGQGDLVLGRGGDDPKEGCRGQKNHR